MFNSSLYNIIERFIKTPNSKEKIKNSYNDIPLNTPVEELDLSVSAFKAFRKAGLNTVGDFLDLRLHNLQKLKDSDTWVVKEISNVIDDLKRFGYKPNFEEQIKNSDDDISLNTPVEELDLSVRAYNILRSEKLKTLKDIVEFELNNIIYIPNAGVGTVREIYKAIERFIKTPNSKEQIKNSYNDIPLNTPVDELDLSVSA